MMKNSEYNGTEEIGLVTPTPEPMLSSNVFCGMYFSSHKRNP